jgi:hypothetical protein
MNDMFIVRHNVLHEREGHHRRGRLLDRRLGIRFLFGGRVGVVAPDRSWNSSWLRDYD